MLCFIPDQWEVVICFIYSMLFFSPATKAANFFTSLSTETVEVISTSVRQATEALG